MKKTFKFLAIAFFAIVTISSCSKKKDDPTPSTNTPASTDGSYYPTTKDNSWTYITPTGNTNYKVTGEKKTIDGKSYSEVAVTGGQSAYILQNGNKYYTNASTNGVTLNLRIIDLDAKIGDTWSTEVQTNQNTMATYTFKYLESGKTRTVNGKEFKDVIAIELKTSAKLVNIPAGMEEMYEELMGDILDQYNTTQVTYYAKNVGLIEQTSESMPQLNISLKEYTVK